MNNRRKFLLKTVTGIPLLAISSLPTNLISQSLKQTAKRADTKAYEIYFESMDAPSLKHKNQMATTFVNSKICIKSGDKIEKLPLSYDTIFTTGDEVSDGSGGVVVAGGNMDMHNRPIIDNSVARVRRAIFSDAPDGTTLLTLKSANIPNIAGNPVFAVVQFEYVTKNLIGADMGSRLPSPIAVITLSQDKQNGKLTLVKYHNIDTSLVHGLWNTCGASLSPWNTHLSSEEYEPDAFAPMRSEASEQLRTYSKNFFGDVSKAKPYYYGHVPEVSVNPDGTGNIKKHYCMGRISHELIEMMPDERTALMGDDHTNGGLFMFVADKKRDLSAGTLYVAKLIEDLQMDGSSSRLKWISLGHATSSEIRDMIDRVEPSDIMSVERKDPKDSRYTKIYINGKPNWIMLKPKMEKAAAFLETHRYAALRGGSMAFTKMEGTTHNADDRVAYSALSYIKDSMVKDGDGWYSGSGVALEKPINSGAVMAMNLKGRQKDTNGKIIESNWVPVDMKALLVGKDIKKDNLGNTSDPNNIGNPDNLKFSKELRTLFIGEDSNRHVNNFLWAYNVDTKKLSRILSAPSGAESTGLFVAENINGWRYIMSNFQHAGDWEDIHEGIKENLDPIMRKNYKDKYGASVGYLTIKN